MSSPFLVDMAQAVNEMLQGVGLVVVATAFTIVLAKVGINKLFQ